MAGRDTNHRRPPRRAFRTGDAERRTRGHHRRAGGLFRVRFDVFQTERCTFIDCDFSGVHVKWLPFGDGGSVFRRCSFRGASIGDFGDVRLERCDFTNADLQGWFTWDADLVECRFGGRLSGVVFNGGDVEGTHENEFVGNDFRDADLDDVAFRLGVDLDAQLLPEGHEYVRIRDVPSRVTEACREVRHWPDRHAALQMLDVLETRLQGRAGRLHEAGVPARDNGLGGARGARSCAARLVVAPKHVGSSGPPWRLIAARQLSPRRDPDEASP